MKTQESAQHFPKTRGSFRLKEPITLGLIVICYVFWAAQAAWPGGPVWLVAPLMVLLTTLHSSLQHEALHGHPTSSRWANEVLVGLPIGLYIPYQRFRDQHLAHHRDETLTDPYDDPESNFLSQRQWQNLPRVVRLVCLLDRSLFGRMIVGPLTGLAVFYWQDAKLIWRGKKSVRRAYAWHLIGMVPVLWFILTQSSFGIWTHLAIAYAGLSVLRIRTFLEHRAAQDPAARTVVINDRGILAFLFLNNNFHAVHHANPTVAWYKLPRLFDAQQDQVLQRNGGYYYKSYWQIIRYFLFRSKDPVVHPYMRRS